MKKLLLFSGLILINCLLDACLPNEAFCYKLEIDNVENYTLVDYKTADSGETVPFNDYAILLNATSMTETCMLRAPFGGSLLADAPLPRLNNEVSNISITSNADLSDNYVAGNELKALFTPILISQNCLDDLGGDSCITDQYMNSGYDNLEDLFNQIISISFAFNSEDELHLFALTSQETPLNNTHEFTVQIDFQNGESIQVTTPPIILN